MQWRVLSYFPRWWMPNTSIAFIKYVYSILCQLGACRSLCWWSHWFKRQSKTCTLFLKLVLEYWHCSTLNMELISCNILLLIGLPDHFNLNSVYFVLQVWPRVLLFLWCWIPRRPTDLSMCILGRRQFWGFSFTFSSRIRTMGLGNFQFTPHDNGCILTKRGHNWYSFKDFCWWLQSQWSPSISIPSSLYRLIRRCY